MELIAASQIRRAQERVQRARPYAEQITRAIGDITGQAENLEHPLLEERKDPKAAAVFVVTSDRGLAGAYSANVLRRTEELIQAPGTRARGPSSTPSAARPSGTTGSASARSSGPGRASRSARATTTPRR